MCVPVIVVMCQKTLRVGKQLEEVAQAQRRGHAELQCCNRERPTRESDAQNLKAKSTIGRDKFGVCTRRRMRM
jgi:hypothetical protein